MPPRQPAALVGARAPRLRTQGVATWPARLSALLVWAAAGFVAAYGVLGWLGQTPATALPASPWVAPEADSQAVARALGAVPVVSGPAAPVPDASGRYALVGVVAQGGTSAQQARQPHGGVALIATDGQRARPYAVGAQLDGRWVVHDVTRRSVVLRPLGAGSPEAGGEAQPNEGSGAITLVLPKP
jgi:hypothetical protein